ncbi:hypothetical protein K3X13_02290 [Aliiroseovarius crassostreae]|uniref:EF-hand domain-containing protein n=1 Tax=Aliiroseovarius crassostreae TaxID=154981 RepID=UPI00220EB06F|nr:hypothetical protein [Aliiroseovarius crassostreae]UWP92710.1 hypothetical protein K3X13_02290 [Aliiroseovarius crassostreae]
MRHFFLLPPTLAIISLTTGAAMAEPSAMVRHFFAQFDTDGSQSVSLKELASARTADFLKFDMDGDRALTAEEFARLTLAHAAHEATPEVNALGDKPHRILASLSWEESDLDGNGLVSKAEYQGNSALWFKRVDTDLDGSITAHELDAW